MDIALFGTVFLDIKGFSANAYDPIGRNVGAVRFIHGGVGRNVAENLGVLGIPVTFASTLDDIAMGHEVIRRLEANGIRTDYMKMAPTRGMGMWMAILDQNGELAGSISQMPDLALFEAMIAEKGSEIIKNASHVALEIDLNETITKRVIEIAKRYGKPIYGIPGNLEVTLRHKELLSEMECFICNDVEAAKLFDAPVQLGDAEQMKAGLARFMEAQDVKSMVVTMGEYGAVYHQRGMREPMRQSVQPVKMVDSTGAGDSFFSGVIAALVKRRSLADAVAYGTKVAAYTIQSEESTCVGFKADD